MKKSYWVFLFFLVGILLVVCFFQCNCDVKKQIVFRDAPLNLQSQIPEKVLICGVAKKIEQAIPNTIESIAELGSRFLDYRVIIYENNSSDNTVQLLSSWAKDDPHVIFLTEKLSSSRFRNESTMKICHRIEKLSRARNIVLDVVKDQRFDDYKYVIWVDLDFLEPWNTDAIVETILHPEHDFDAVFANSDYDVFALRTPNCPIGFELIGNSFFSKCHEIQKEFLINENEPWKRVYSAFGGIGIYKRQAIIGSRYSAVVTLDLDKQISKWLSEVPLQNVLYGDLYQQLIAENPVLEIDSLIENRSIYYPNVLGTRLKGGHIVMFSCTSDTPFPWTCEHVTLHASMAEKGFNRFYINPKIKNAWIPPWDQ